MRWTRRTLAIGIVFSFLAGGIAAMMPSSIPSQDAASVHVPVGRVGDEFAYVADYQGWRDRGGQVSWSNGTVETAYHVQRIANVLDPWQVPRDALHVRVRHTDEALPAPLVWTTHVDLGTRDWFLEQGTFHYVFDGQESVGGWMDFGPRRESLYAALRNPNHASLADGQNETFEFQGRTLRPTSDLTAAELTSELRLRLDGTQEPPAPATWTTFVPRTQTYRSHTTPIGMVEGFRALGVQREIQLHFDVASASFGPASMTRTFRTTVWLADDVPYPVRIDRSLEWSARRPADDSRPHEQGKLEVRETLAGWRPGVDPIPWQSADSGPARRAWNAAIERSAPGSSTLQSGSGSGLEYSFDQALRDVEQAPTLLGFQAWRAQNPGARLASAQYVSGSSLPVPSFAYPVDFELGRTWYFSFVALGRDPGPGSAFSVAASQDVRTGARRVVEQDSTCLGPGPRLTADDFPAQPITLAALEREWRKQVPGTRDGRAPTYVAWGPSVRVAASNDPSACKYYLHGGARDLGSVELGELSPIGLLPAGKPPAHYWPTNFSYVSADAATGRLVGSFWAKAQVMAGPWVSVPPEAQRHLPPVLASPATDRAAANSAIPWTDAWTAGALTTGTLLAILLASYFYPLLKFAATHAWTLVPGYAKLRKDGVLDNAYREQIANLVRAEPGISPPEIHSRVGGGWSTIVYHLGILERNEVLTSLLDGRHRRFFPRGTIDWSRREQVAVLRNDRTKVLYDLICDAPGTRQATLAHRLGISRAATQWHLERLVRSGLVRVQREPGRMEYFAASTPPMVRGIGVEVA